MIELFLILHLSSLAAIVALHAGRARFTLAPVFGGCAILTFLMWQLLQTAWWIQVGGTYLHAAVYASLPAILCGLVLVYAMDGSRAARAYLLTMAVTAATCLLFNEFLFQLSHQLPIATIFRLPARIHLILAIALVGAGLAELLAYELVLRRLPTGIAMAAALIVGIAAYLALQSLLTYGIATGLRNIANQYPTIAMAGLLPALAAAVYGSLAQRARIVLPARRPVDLFAVWHRTEAQLAEARESFFKARETIAELRTLNRAVETEKRLRAHQVERSAQAILEIDRRGRIAKCNEAARMLLRRGVPEGLAIEQLLPGFAAFLGDPNQTSATLPLSVGPETPARRIRVTAMRIGEQDYGPAYSVLAEDVTEREQLAFARGVAERVRGIQMTGRVIGHDLANLMLAVEGNLARLRAALGPAAPEAVETSLRAIAGAAQRSREMMRELGTQQAFALPELRACDLRALADEAIALQRARADGAGVRLTVEGPVGITVAADRTQMVRVMMNLIGNSIRACRRGGRIVVALGTDAEGAFLRVQDDGIGMTREQLERAFDPGFTTKAGGQGGLGLAISYLIVDAHGGHLSLASAPGEGATATVRLPISTLRVLPADAGPLLLVIENDEARERCAAFYRSLGGEVVEIAAAEELEEVLSDQPPAWELIIRTLHPALREPTRRALAASAQILVGPRRTAQRGIDKCHLSNELTRELADRARTATGQIAAFSAGAS